MLYVYYRCVCPWQTTECIQPFSKSSTCLRKKANVQKNNPHLHLYDIVVTQVVEGICLHVQLLPAANTPTKVDLLPTTCYDVRDW